MINAEIVAGIDIGGSHITASLIDLNNKAVLPNSLIRKSINSHGSATEIIYDWVGVIKNVFKNYNFDKKLGIAMPGPFDYETGISLIKNQGKYDSLYGLNIKNLLSKNLQIPETNIRLANDAACFLYGEIFSGAAKGFDKAMGLTLGTGLGSARFNNGISEDADLWQSPFLDGIAEDYFSTRWFVKEYFELTGVTVRDVKALIHLGSSDVEKNAVFNRFGKNLALFLKDFILNEKPEVIVIGGNIAHAYELFFPLLYSNLPKCSHTFFLRKATLGENGNLIGAASVWSKNMVSV